MPEAREWFYPRPVAPPEQCSEIGVVARQFREVADQSEEAAFQRRYVSKLYSRVVRKLIGFPSLVAGLKRIFLATAMAFSVNPRGNPCITFSIIIWPSAAKITPKITIPCTLLSRASSVYLAFSLPRIVSALTPASPTSKIGPVIAESCGVVW